MEWRAAGNLTVLRGPEPCEPAAPVSRAEQGPGTQLVDTFRTCTTAAPIDLGEVDKYPYGV